MKYLPKILVLFIIFLGITIMIIPAPSYAYVSVKGYYRSNGTYVQPYVRSSPNALKYDNYSYTGGNRYNSSYYSSSRNYSSNWYQPSYVTDPSYYSGRSIYQSRYRY